MTVPVGFSEQYGLPRVSSEPKVSEHRPAAPSAEDKLLGPSFSEQLADFVGGVDRTEKLAQHKAEDFAAGRQNDIHGTMIAVEQAEISLHLLANVRNRVVDLYREVMRMGS